MSPGEKLCWVVFSLLLLLLKSPSSMLVKESLGIPILSAFESGSGNFGSGDAGC